MKRYKNIKISIITVTYNCENMLKKTVNSLKNQTAKDFEWIVIDGKSSDGTLNIINNNTDRIDILISEPDKGIYDAMNKGIYHSSGEYLFFLNAGDEFTDENVLKNVIENLDDSDILYGNIIMKKGINYIKKTFPKKLDFKFMIVDTICHQCVFMRKNVVYELGMFNIEEKIFADYEIWLKIYRKKNKFKIKHINRFICMYDLTGASSKLSLLNTMVSRSKLFFKYNGVIKGILYFLIWITYKIPYSISWKKNLKRYYANE